MSDSPSQPPSNGRFNGRVTVPSWLFALIVLAASGVDVARLLLNGAGVCP